MFRVCEKEPSMDKYPLLLLIWLPTCSHINGEMCIVFESNQGLAIKNQHTPEQIYEMHLILFTETFKFAKELKLRRKQNVIN